MGKCFLAYGPDAWKNMGKSCLLFYGPWKGRNQVKCQARPSEVSRQARAKELAFDHKLW